MAGTGAIDALDPEPESHRAKRFREIATRALRPISILAPIALVLCAGLIPPARAEHGWATVLGVTAIMAVLLLFAELVLVRLFEAQWARTGVRGLSLRESGILALHVFLVIWWCGGLNALAHGPGPNDGLGSLAFINGCFGAAVTLGLLLRAASRRVPA
jgi:hypothetical protein